MEDILEIMVIFSLSGFCIGHIVGTMREKKKSDFKVDAIRRQIKCFYKPKKDKKSMESIANDAVALGGDFTYFKDSLDLYYHWYNFRNCGVNFPTHESELKKKYSKSTKDDEIKIKLSQYSITVPHNFKPVEIDLEEFKGKEHRENYRHML